MSSGTEDSSDSSSSSSTSSSASTSASSVPSKSKPGTSNSTAKSKASNSKPAPKKKDKKKAVSSSSSSSSDSSSSSSDSSSSEDEASPPPVVNKAPAKKAKPAPRKRRRSSTPDDDAAFEEFKHIFDTKEEFLDCMMRTEKEKEMIIFNRIELYEQRQNRLKIEKSLLNRQQGEAGSDVEMKEEKKKEPAKKVARGRPPKKAAPKPPVDDTDSELDASFHQPTDIERKKKQKAAMSSLAQKRKEKKSKEERKKEALSCDAVFGENEKAPDGRSSSSSGSESDSDTSSSNSSSSSSVSESEPEPVVEESRPIENIQELQKARITREALAKLIYTPMLEKVAVGSFVLFRTTAFTLCPHTDVHIWKILEVETVDKPYNLETLKTDKALKCAIGERVRILPMNCVSNSTLTDAQFDDFKRLATEEQFPTLEYVQQKQAEIYKARNPHYSKEVVEYMVKEKNRFGQGHVNHAMKKSELIMKRDFYRQNGDTEKAAKIQKEIDEIEKTASELEKLRQGNIAHVNMINKKNRTIQSDKFFKPKPQQTAQEVEEETPFTRKKERMKVVCGTSKAVAATNAANAAAAAAATALAAPDLKENNDVEPKIKGPEALPVKGPEPPKLARVTVAPLTKKLQETRIGDGKPDQGKKINLHDLHASIDFDIDMGALPSYSIPGGHLREGPSAIPTRKEGSLY